MTDSTSNAGEQNPVLTVCLVSHTHWDREWYHPAARFRQQLVALVDGLLQKEGGDPLMFLLDGQTIVLEDYLAVRPEMRSRLAERLRLGGLEAGPWYVLADTLIPSGEALVRNLLVGRRMLAQLGARAPAVAYCPDTFGHSHAIPTLAHGFGFPLAIVWRGYGGSRAPHGDTVRWQSDNREEVLLYHLPPDGYEIGSSLPREPEQLTQRWSTLRQMYADHSSTGTVLLPNGADHHALQSNLDEIAHHLRLIASPDLIVRVSLQQFADGVLTAAGSELAAPPENPKALPNSRPVGDDDVSDAASESHSLLRMGTLPLPLRLRLPLVQGELRDSYGYTWTLSGTLGTRAAQKRANARAERALLRDVEPWLVLAWLHGGMQSRAVSSKGNITLAQAPALLDAAWRTLLRAHPHDTLCGCSIDAVARAMDVRLESAVAQARGLRQVALNLALRHDPVVARSVPLCEQSSVVIRNRASYARGGVVEMLLDETVRDVPVGPASADGFEGATARGPARADSRARPVLDAPTQFLATREVFRRRESPQHYPDNDLVLEHRVLAWVPPVPALGLAILPVQANPGQRNESTSDTRGTSASDGQFPTGAPLPAIPNAVSVRGEDGVGCTLDNGIVTVRADVRGVHIAVTGRGTFQDAISFETCRDVGDSYTPAIRGTPETLSVTNVRPRLGGPLRGSVELRLTTTGKRSRIMLRATISLDANADFVRIDVRGDNRRRNHRLRMTVRTDVPGTGNIATYADAAFGPVLRVPLDVPVSDQAREMVPPTMPMHRWATLTSASKSATVHSDGLAEVEANAEAGTLSLTLLRAIGELSRSNLPERPGHAGWPASIPLAQSIGAFRARLAVQFGGAWSQQTRDDIERASDNLLLPLVACTMRDLAATPGELYGPTLSGEGLRCSTTALADDGDGIVLRSVNDAPREVLGWWNLPANSDLEFAAARLDETLLGEWQPVNGTIQFTSPPRGVVTIRVRRRELKARPQSASPRPPSE